MNYIVASALATNIFYTISLFLGLIICFSGYRLFRPVIAIAGFVLGSFVVAGALIEHNNIDNIQLIIITALFFGILTSIILSSMFSTALFLLGAVFGVLIFDIFLALNEILVEPNSYIFPALAGGIITFIFRHSMMILITSALGAWLVIIGAVYIATSGLNPLYSGIINNIIAIEPYRFIKVWIALTTLGFTAQIIIFIPKKYVYKYLMQYYDKA